MAIQYESEEEKKKLAAAEDYLAKRDAFLKTQKPGYTVDMTGEDTSKMSDDQIKAEGNRRIAEAKTSFQNSFSGARAAGFGSDPTKAVQEYLSRRQAKEEGLKFSVGPGAVADEATADRILSNLAAQAAPPTSNRPNWGKIQESIDRKREDFKAREAAHTERFKKFRETKEQEESINRQAQQDITLAKLENSNARLVERAHRVALQRYITTRGRRGALVSPEAMDAATARLARSEMGLGTKNNEDDRYKFARSQITNGRRYNPWGRRESSWATPSQSAPVDPSPNK
jgi:hypothetical protein